MKNRILIISGVVLLVVLIAGGFVGYRVKKVFLAAGTFRKLPDELRDAKIVRGEGRFSKASIFTRAELGLITDFKQNSNHELVVVAQNGAAFLKDSNLDRTISFNRCSSAVVGADLGVGSFLCRGGWNTNVELFDSAGKTLWSYSGGLQGIDDAAAGTLGPNATPSVVVGFNGGGGIRRLSVEGKELWQQSDGNVWHVEILPGKIGQCDPAQQREGRAHDEGPGW